MATTPTYINQRINNLQAQINALQPYPPPETQTLSQVLANGNSAGTFSIDMNNQDITAVDNIDLVTINGSAYPPPSTPSSSVFNYKAHTNSQAPPVPNGQIEWNNLTQSSATQIYISHVDDDGDDIQVLLSALPLGTIFLIQDQAIGSNYQRWTITSVSSVINQYITFGVTLLTSTHSFSNNDPVLLIIQSANQNLSQVLAVGNSAGVYDIDLNGNDILNAPLIQSQNNQNITIQGLGNGDVILRTAGTNQVVVDDTGLTTFNTRELINYTGVGGTANPTFATIKNNATAGLIYEPKTITGRNVIVNEELYRMSVIGQTATVASQEFARIGVSSTNVGTGNNDGSIGFWASVNGVISEVFRMSGADNENNSFRPLDMNNNNIVNVATGIFTAVSSTTCSIGTGNFSTINASTIQDTASPLIYFPSFRTFVSSLLYTFPTPIKLFHDFFIYSQGIAPSLTTSLKSPAPQGFCQASTTITFNGRTILADNNSMYWWDSLNSIWQNFYSFNGSIKTMCISDDGYLWVGGEFIADVFSSVVYNYVARFDNSCAIMPPITWNNVGDVGFNNPVYTLATNNAGNGYIYAGGVFTYTGGNFLQLDRFACIVSGIQDIYSIDGQVGTGFDSIVNTISTQGTKIFIGGQFSNGTANSGGFGQTTFNYPYGMIWDSNGYQSTFTTGSEMIYIGGNPSSLNSNVDSSAYNSDNGIVWISGTFTNVDMTGENYLFGLDLNNPTNIVSTGYTFNNPVSSVKGSTGFVSNNLVVAIDTSTYDVISLVGGGSFVLGSGFFGSNIAGVEYDQNDNTIDLFFTATSTILSYNPSQTTTIDLNTQGIYFIYNGSSYNGSCILNGSGAWIEGVCINTSPFTYNITALWNTGLIP